MAYFKTWQTGPTKYRNVKKNYNGFLFDSQKEANKAAELDMLVKSKAIKGYEKQVKEALMGQNGTKVCHYYCDFLLLHNDGTKEFLEIKSKVTATPIWKLKWKLLQDKYKDDKSVMFTVEY